MKKSILVALLLSAFAFSSFAQGTPESAGARRVAERDAEYAKNHPVLVQERVLKKHTQKHLKRVQHRRAKRHASR